SIHHALAIAAVTSVAGMWIAQRTVVDRGTEEDHTPTSVLKVPAMAEPPRAGRIQLCVEYRIDPARAEEFLLLMEESRRSRMRQGALDWQLLHDLYEPGCYVEQIIDASWTEHLRRFDRVSAADVALRDRRLAFHLGEEPPRVRRYLLEQQ